MKKIILLRWLFLIPAIYASWYVVFIAGFFTYRFIEKDLCPKGDLSSGFCHNQVIINILEIAMHTFVALSAVAVLSTAILMAPFYKTQISYVVFLLGSIVAFYIGSQLQLWSLIAAAIVAGLLLLIAHSRLSHRRA